MSHVRKYFRTELSSYFKWADHGRELCWCNGTTIAFHEEIVTAFDRLADQKLPDFSTLALGLATLRSSWSEISAQLTHAVTLMKHSPNPLIRHFADSRLDLFERWPATLRKLGLLTTYAETRSPSTQQRAELLAIVLSDFPGSFTSEIQDEITTAFRAGLPDDCVNHQSQISDVEALLLPINLNNARLISESNEATSIAVPRIVRLIRIASSLAASIPCASVDELDQLLRTGITEDIKPPEEPLLDQRLLTQSLLAELSNDEELQGFARLTKQLIAAVTLPRALSEPDELQMGGISDITNRGELDKLLLSELAYDDLTLAVRLATNEALYMRRESPPSHQTKTRNVLIDLSLPMWGIPRLYAAAAALALHATSDKSIRVNCFRSSTTGISTAPLVTRNDMLDHLSILEPTAHPGESLEAFFHTVTLEPLSAEPVLITTSDVLENDAFRTAIDKASVKGLWLIIVERDGRLKILQRTRQGTSVYKQLQLPLEEILRHNAAKRIRRTDVADDLPAIFHLADFPLLLSHQTRIGRLWTWGTSAVAISDDGRLMHWTEKGLGARQLTTGLPGRDSAKIFVVQRPTKNFLQFLICPAGANSGIFLTVSTVHQDTKTDGASHRLSLVTDIVSTESALLVFGKLSDGTQACSAIVHDTGDFLGTYKFGDDVIKRTGRCLATRTQGFCVLNWVDGQSSWVLQKLPPHYQTYLDMVEPRNGAYFALAGKGQVADPENAARFKSLNEQLQSDGIRLRSVVEISYDGQLILMNHQPESATSSTAATRNVSSTTQPVHPSSFSLIDFDRATRLPCIQSHSAESFIEKIEFQRAIQAVRQHTPHYRFNRIGSAIGKLLLKDSGGGLFQVTWDSNNQVIRLEPETTSADATSFVEFVDTPVKLNNGFTLQIAEWANGSKAWLDSRGLMHLKSANRSLPEITLAMRDGSLSGWLSSGDVFGDNYYCGKGQSASGLRRTKPESAWNSAIRPFIESLPWTFHFSSDTAHAAPQI